MALTELLDRYSVSYTTEGGKVTKGWVGVNCPFCVGSQEFHLGFHLDTWASSCWRCGRHSTVESLMGILSVTEDQARALIKEYRTGGGAGPDRTKANRHVQIHPFKLPSYCGPLGLPHRAYLERRRFDPDKLAKEWDIVGTGPISMLDKVNYRFRIVAPIIWDKRTVSFQSRDYTGKSDYKYLACVPGREVVSHKAILYGQQAMWKDTGICVEGITDVWRLGSSAFATFGIEYATEQLIHIVDQFKRVIVLFDPERQAQNQARKLVARLRACAIETVVEQLTDCDPGDMKQDDADHLVRNLLRRVV